MDDADDDAPVDLVATVGPLDAVVETLRDVLHRSGSRWARTSRCASSRRSRSMPRRAR
jgi:hypothetical protein